MIRWIVRLEGLTIFLFSLYFYYSVHGNWLLFILLFLVPDISMIGYLKNTKLGSTFYNLIHNYVLAIGILALSMLLQNFFLLESGIILLSHVGIDRFFGFGLKYPTKFKDTHIQKL